jgi:hypothetical protein
MAQNVVILVMNASNFYEDSSAESYKIYFNFCCLFISMTYKLKNINSKSNNFEHPGRSSYYELGNISAHVG